MIKSVTKNNYFPSNFAFKLVQRFPSLSHIELQVYSFDYYTLIDDPFTCEYIIMKRCQAFFVNTINEQMVKVINNGQFIEIWLS
ncbi:unnamed protein product [Rotaria sordida]|uniref:Uncharacterized protein n=1 Tax=Rotaria sordida TaxID=392033 RepID=A0A819USH7_9BILA|nr:unnamed protein product [Rotaria sordida]CAF4099803.1 unnamed protein product [Rotaria sordida]